MLRLIKKTVIFAIAISASLYIGVQWKLNEDLKYLSSRLAGNVSVEYDNAVLTLSGNVILSKVKLYFRTENINVSIEQLSYSSGSIFRMAFLRKQLKGNTIAENTHIKLDNVVLSLTPSLVKLINSMEDPGTLDSLTATSCGNVKQLGINEYFSMGYDQIAFSSELKLSRNAATGSLTIQGNADVKNTSQASFSLTLDNVFDANQQVVFDDGLRHISYLDIVAKDNGYNQRRNNFCSVKEKLTANEYIEKHIKDVADKLKSVGIGLTAQGKKSYKMYLLSSSEYHLTLQPQAIFTMKDFGYYDEAELRELLGLKYTINQQTVGQVFEHWDLNEFNKIDFSKDDEQVAGVNPYQTVVVHRTYQLENINQAKTYVKYKVRVTKKSGKKFEGKLASVNDKGLVLSMNLHGGSIQKNIKWQDVKQFYVYKVK